VFVKRIDFILHCVRLFDLTVVLLLALVQVVLKSLQLAFTGLKAHFGISLLQPKFFAATHFVFVRFLQLALRLLVLPILLFEETNFAVEGLELVLELGLIVDSCVVLALRGTHLVVALTHNFFLVLDSGLGCFNLSLHAFNLVARGLVGVFFGRVSLADLRHLFALLQTSLLGFSDMLYKILVFSGLSVSLRVRQLQILLVPAALQSLLVVERALLGELLQKGDLVFFFASVETSQLVELLNERVHDLHAFIELLTALVVAPVLFVLNVLVFGL
jgi:hypothetical protein